MLANLSIVLDKDKEIRLDILKNMPLSQIDEFTTERISSSQIRAEFNEEITEFLNQHQDFIATFKKEANKRGSLVIIYNDENDKLHRMRVLYKENKTKTDTNLILKKVFDIIRKNQNPYFTIELIKYFDFFLGSDFNYREVSRIERVPSNNPDILRRQNQRLVNLIRNNVKYVLDKNYEKGYFYLRLIDAYLERKGFETTKRSIKTKTGTVKVSKNIKISSTKVTKEQPYKKVIEPKEEPLEETEDLYHMDEDGQYSFIKTEPKKKIKKRYISVSEKHLELLEEDNGIKR